MAPEDIVTSARRKRNATNDTAFHPDAYLYDLLYEAQLALARRALVIEDVDTSITTVAGTQSYTYPSGTLGIKRIEYDGKRLRKITFREDDLVTNYDFDSTDTGTPNYFALFDDLIYLRPVPDDAKTLRIFRYKEPSRVTSGGTVETPSQFHMGITDYMVSEMWMKDQQFNLADRYAQKWENTINEARKWQRKRQRLSDYSQVQDEDTTAISRWGLA